MLNLIANNNKQGFGIIEVVMATLLLMLGVVSMMQLIPLGWVNTSSADSRTGAAEIMARELESTQHILMNPCNIIVAASGGKSVYLTGHSGLTRYDIQKSLTPDGMGWIIAVTVTNGNTTISGIRKVIRQTDYAYPNVAGSRNCLSMTSIDVIGSGEVN